MKRRVLTVTAIVGALIIVGALPFLEKPLAPLPDHLRMFRNRSLNSGRVNALTPQGAYVIDNRMRCPAHNVQFLTRVTESGRVFVYHEWSHRKVRHMKVEGGNEDIELDSPLRHPGTTQDHLRHLIGPLATE